MTATKEGLFAFLDRLQIMYQTVEHPRFYTVEEGRVWHDKIPGLPCKNLFLKDKKNIVWLVCMPGDKRAHLKQLEKALGSARLSFGSAELLFEHLGLSPGSVTPFALMNDQSHKVNVVLDKDRGAAPLIHFHPLENCASTALSPEGLLRFINALGHRPRLVDCGPWLEEKRL